MFKSGFVSVIGRPNVGKSTLVNAVVGQKVSIVTHKAQTTRHRILGIKSSSHYQIVLVDTPGYHLNAKQAINKMMNKATLSALHEVEAVIFVVEACQWRDEEQTLITQIEKIKVPVFVAVNKIDLIHDKDRLLPYISKLSSIYRFAAIVPISARSAQGVDLLEKEIIGVLPAGLPIYELDDVTDKNLRFQAAELIREQLYLALSQELPYAATVEIEAFEETEKIFRIAAIIWVSRASHKGIVIGKQGAGLKSIAQSARLSMESAFQKKIYLNVWVKVKEGWNDDERALHKMGYRDR
ncbi:MAG: GTPase Era [Gammaproteobacteria bacterium]|nr:GTPase Era [Gammaproteobacteria bacterium]